MRENHFLELLFQDVTIVFQYQVVIVMKTKSTDQQVPKFVKDLPPQLLKTDTPITKVPRPLISKNRDSFTEIDIRAHRIYRPHFHHCTNLFQRLQLWLIRILVIHVKSTYHGDLIFCTFFFCAFFLLHIFFPLGIVIYQSLRMSFYNV